MLARAHAAVGDRAAAVAALDDATAEAAAAKYVLLETLVARTASACCSTAVPR